MDLMNFAEAMEAVVDGDKLRRKEWPEDGTYIVLLNEQLKIFTPKDKTIRPLIVSKGDILGEDWMVVTVN